jgi:glycosyltransferase involved in cell wall biosynthesis
VRIGISLLSAGPQRTGVENAAANLITQLSGMGSEDEYVVYVNRRNLRWLPDMPGCVRVIDVRLSSSRARWLWEHLFFLTSRHPKEVDVVHFPIGGGVMGYRGKFVLTIHDLNHYLNRDLTRLRRHLLWRACYKANVKRAARIVTVSEHVKRDILREFPVRSDSIRVIHNGVDRRFKPCAASQVFREKYRLPERYILFVGATAINKNIRRAIDAVKLVRNRYGLDHQFIIAGSCGEDDASLKKYVNSNNLRDTVRFVGYVDDDDLPQLYVNAEVFLFPSIMEGFGIPPLEAMRCGIPVVAGLASCMPEVLGDAPIWVNPLSVESIAEGVGTVLLDRNVRSRAIAKGLSRAEQFSWEKMTSETVNVYREIADSPMTNSDVWDPGDAAIASDRDGRHGASRWRRCRQPTKVVSANCDQYRQGEDHGEDSTNL